MKKLLSKVKATWDCESNLSNIFALVVIFGCFFGQPNLASLSFGSLLILLAYAIRLWVLKLSFHLLTPYGFVRYPCLLSFALLCLGYSLITVNWLHTMVTIFVLSAHFRLVITNRERKYLVRKDIYYLNYQQSVPALTFRFKPYLFGNTFTDDFLWLGRYSNVSFKLLITVCTAGLYFVPKYLAFYMSEMWRLPTAIALIVLFILRDYKSITAVKKERIWNK